MTNSERPLVNSGIAPNFIRPIVIVIFFITGGLGLLYQLVWFKYLSYYIGSTAQAQAVVLAAFMGGMAIGAAIWGKRADTSNRPLLVYGLLETGVGVYAALFPLLFSMLRSEGAPLGVRLIVGGISILIPTILMGGTLPALTSYFTQQRVFAGKAVASLYFTNSFGAVAGIFIAGFWAIESAGLRFTLLSGSITNLLAAAGVIFVSAFGTNAFEETKVRTRNDEKESATARVSSDVKIAALVAGLSGCAAMIYEVGITRVLVTVLGSSVHSYAIMLAAFITGITIGSWSLRYVARKIRDVRPALGVIQIAVSASMLMTMPLYSRLPYWFWEAASLLTRTDTSYALYATIQLSLSFVILLPPAIFLGMSLPLAVQLASAQSGRAGNTTGKIFAVNTAGTVLGSLGAGMVLLPLVGVRTTLEIGILINAIAGFTAIFTSTTSKRKKQTIALAAIVPLFLYAVSPSWNKTIFLSGVYRSIAGKDMPPTTFEAFRRLQERRTIRFYEEGVTATVAVTETRDNGIPELSLSINGKVDASTRGDLGTQVLLGQLPMALHPHPSSALIIGLGGGVTAGSVLTHPVTAVTVVEISPEVVRGSRYFDEVSGAPLNDPRLTLVIDDARTFVASTDSAFDIVISEPSNPWIAGIASLYTTEFYKACEQKLKPDGLLVQWYHLYETSDEVVRSVIATLKSVFPHVTVWQGLSADLLIVASKSPLRLDFGRTEKLFSDPKISADLQRIGIENPFTIYSLQMMSETTTSRYVGMADPNTEDNLFVEYRAARSFFLNPGTPALNGYDERRYANNDSLFLSRLIQFRTPSDQELRSLALYHANMTSGNPFFGYGLLKRYASTHPDDASILRATAELSRRLGLDKETLEALKKLAYRVDSSADDLVSYANILFTQRRPMANAMTPAQFGEEKTLFDRAVSLSNDRIASARVARGEFYFSLQEWELAAADFQRAIQIFDSTGGAPLSTRERLLIRAAKSFDRCGKNGVALLFAAEAMRLNPANDEARDLALTIWTGAIKRQLTK